MYSKIIEFDDPLWINFLNEYNHEFYQVPEYLKLEQEISGGKILAFYFKRANSSALMPFLIKNLEYPINGYEFDSKSPYGYSGILFSKDFNIDYYKDFFSELITLSKDLGILTHFIRLNPIYNNQKFPLSKVIDQQMHGPTVFVDLKTSLKELESNISSNHRRNINKLVKSDYRTVVNDWSHYEDFKDIYSESMIRLNAKDYYRFESEYFEKLRRILGKNMLLASVVDNENKVVSAAIFSSYNSIVQYHLGATSSDHLDVAPSKLLFKDVISYFKEMGAEILHLGGGLATSEDSLFNFKKGFSKSLLEFCSLNIITDYEKYGKYNELVMKLKNSKPEDPDFFPVYRNV